MKIMPEFEKLKQSRKELSKISKIGGNSASFAHILINFKKNEYQNGVVLTMN